MFYDDIVSYFNHYYPLEKKPGIEYEEKCLVMEEWY
jgi:hypothetical protein